MREVGKLISYFENFINDLNKDLPSQSKWKSISETHLAHPAIRTTSENTSNLSITCNEAQPTTLPTIQDEDLYDRLTYQTLARTNSSSIGRYVHQDQLTQSSKHSTKRRQSQPSLQRKRLHRRRAPTYIKELKAYLAHRQSSVTDLVKISDVKKFSHVLVWLANQTNTSPSLIETPSIQAEIVSTESNTQQDPQSNSITNDSFLRLTQQSSQWDSGNKNQLMFKDFLFRSPTI